MTPVVGYFERMSQRVLGYCGAGTGRPNLSIPSPGWSFPGAIAQLFSSITRQFSPLGIEDQGGGAQLVDAPPIWNSCQSVSASLEPSSLVISITEPEEDVIDSGESVDPAGSSINFPSIPAFCIAAIKFVANSLGSHFPIYAKFVGWKCPAFNFATSAPQFTYSERGNTALSMRSSRHRSRAVRRCSWSKLASALAVSVLATCNWSASELASFFSPATAISALRWSSTAASLDLPPNLYSPNTPTIIMTVPSAKPTRSSHELPLDSKNKTTS